MYYFNGVFNFYAWCKIISQYTNIIILNMSTTTCKCVKENFVLHF